MPNGLPTLEILPDENGYSVQSTNEVITARPSEGPSRSRRKAIGTPFVVPVNYTVSETEWSDLDNFYNLVVDKTGYFNYKLLISSAVLTSHVCKFIAPPTLQSVNGLTYRVAATIEVLPNTRLVNFDASIATLFSVYPDSGREFMNGISTFINVDVRNIQDGG